MQKQKKNSNYKKDKNKVSLNSSNAENKLVNKFEKNSLKNKKFVYKFKKLLKYQFFKLLLLVKKTSKVKRKFLITITANPNNIFCTVRNLLKQKTIFCRSAGQYKIKISKKSLKYANSLVLKKFLKEVKKRIKANIFYISVTAPVRVRSRIIRQVHTYLKETRLIVNAVSKKCFNGCRPPKQRRKKRKKFRIFK